MAWPNMFSSAKLSRLTPVTNLMGWLAFATTVGAVALNATAELIPSFTTERPFGDDPITNSSGNTTAAPPTDAPSSDDSFDYTKLAYIGGAALGTIALIWAAYRSCTKGRSGFCSEFNCCPGDFKGKSGYSSINNDDEEEKNCFDHPCFTA